MKDNILGLIENRQYAKVRAEVAEWNEADVADLLEELPEEEALKVFRLLPKDMAAEVFSFLPIEMEHQIITSLSEREAYNIIENLYADDAADLLEEMPANVVKRILANASVETRHDINQLLQYPEDSAGSLMTVEYTALKEEWTVEQAIEDIRRHGMKNETINTCYVLTNSRKLVGIVSLRELLLNDPSANLKDIMEDRPITVHTKDDQEEVARDFQKYDFTVMPVVDSENRLVGIITVDDIVDIIEQEATEDMEKMAAIVPSDKPYMKTSVIELVKKRIPWLLLLMISATFTGMIITSFEEKLAACVALTAYIPMLMDTGGNAGGQASVSIIRGISLNEIEFEDIFRVIWKEIRVALCCGLILAAANFVKLLVVDRVELSVDLVICLTLVVTVFCAKFVGCTLPILAKKIGFDPAVMASPFITTIVDAISLAVYFNFATLILGL
ncbi:MAG: magnesium transporter [Lachnospiraceae bacterium]|nr:magnesium transporter [Lachnospiraceae bacterium]